ncbi:cytochrome P450 [Aspergillus homomorphus CBS 101889]|uniref:Cytochrome P450 n=1 Tax=Aspergillus homomorphus (strain CBS 101889) TaxID=1450537 RepID=A0A395HX34_ASPHC|nr:cytochrome P450 [Aspergillus homomorphus CBS 101889]RAL12471.1 cytochrome P450 [Aspergillus homomorphus CBS 101889]
MQSTPLAAQVVAVVLPLVLTLALYHLTRALFPSQRRPKQISWIGRGPGVLNSFRACLSQWRYKPALLQAGYETFNQAGRAFLMPLISFEPIVILPQEQITWIIEQPPAVLCPRRAAYTRMGVRYVAPGFTPATSEVLHSAIKIHLNKKFDLVAVEMYEQMSWAIDRSFGTATCARQVSLGHALRYAVYHTLVPVLAGSELAQNERFVDAMISSSQWFGAASTVVGQCLPPPVRGVIGWMLQKPIGYFQRGYLEYLMPVVRDRLRRLQEEEGEKEGEKAKIPQDMVTWLCQVILKTKGTTRAEEVFADGFNLLLGAAFTSTVFTAHHTLLDILGSSAKDEIFQTLRREAESTLDCALKWSDPVAILQLQYIDSTLRESLRLAPPTSMALLREVVPEDGVRLPNGQFLNKGSWLAVPSIPIHGDQRFYESPHEFRPFRFVQERKVDSCVSTSDTFLSFGHGRSACAGRQFATRILKMMLAYIVMHYDIEAIDGRPLNFFMGEHPVPPDVVVNVRRRV